GGPARPWSTRPGSPRPSSAYPPRRAAPTATHRPWATGTGSGTEAATATRTCCRCTPPRRTPGTRPGGTARTAPETPDRQPGRPGAPSGLPVEGPRPGPLRVEALAAQPGQGVDAGGGARGVDLHVEVGAGGVAGGAHPADDLAGGDLLADADADRGLVGVPDLGAVVEGQHRLVAVGAVPAGGGDRAGVDGLDQRAAGGGEVEAGVLAGGPVGAGLTEGRGERVGGGRQRVLRGQLGEALGLGLLLRLFLGLPLRFGGLGLGLLLGLGGGLRGLLLGSGDGSGGGLALGLVLLLLDLRHDPAAQCLAGVALLGFGAGGADAAERGGGALGRFLVGDEGTHVGEVGHGDGDRRLAGLGAGHAA